MFYLITGASQGIGYEISKLLYRNNNKLILCSRKVNHLKKKFKKNTLLIPSDLTKIKDIKKIKKKLIKEKIKIKTIISCHAELGEPVCIFEKKNKKKWLNIFETNFISNINLIYELMPLIIKNDYSKIIFFSGGGVFTTWPKFSSYSVSKTALVKYMENLSSELKEFKIIVNAIAPGFLNTNIHKRNIKKLKNLNERYKDELRKNKNKKPNFKNVKGLIQFLINNKNINLSGKTISANFDKWKDKKKFLMKLSKYENSLQIIRRNI